jgi:para-nitrobenzyl esterase
MNVRIVRPLFALAACTLVSALFAQAPPAGVAGVPIPGDPVKIDGGLVAGRLVAGNVKAYLGIPYAASTAGDNRWREPQPVKAWAGVRAADQYGAPCAQRAGRGGGPVPSEDCLFLNVWAPANSTGRKLPVIVFIHGAGYSSGSAAGAMLSGETLARKGVVYVNLNYRLSVLASLAHPELSAESPHRTSGNYIHLDQVAALQWVHRNIANFGGDPANVTLSGQSSGAIDVGVLQASPLTKGLIHKVLGMSGGGFPAGGPWPATPLKEAELAGVKFQERLGAKSLAEMRAMPFEKLLDPAMSGPAVPIGADGYFLLAKVPEVFTTHKQNDIPALACSTRDEGMGALSSVRTLDQYKETLQRVAGAKAAEIMKLYPATNDQEAQAAGVKAGHAAEFGKQSVMWAEAQAASGKAPAYVAVFARGNPAGHGSDVPYWLGTVNLTGAAPGGPGRGRALEPYDAELAGKMSDAFVAFAKTGNPSTPAVKWPRYDSKNPQWMNLGDKVEAAPVDKGHFYFIANPDIQIGLGAGGGRGSAPAAPGRGR